MIHGPMILGITVHGIIVRTGLIHTGIVPIGALVGAGAVSMPVIMTPGITEVVTMVDITAVIMVITIIIIVVLITGIRRDVRQRLITVVADVARVIVRREAVRDVAPLHPFADRLHDHHPVSRQLHVAVVQQDAVPL